MIDNITQISTRYLKQNKLRTVLSALSIILAVAIITVGGSLLVGIRDLMEYTTLTGEGYHQGKFKSITIEQYKKLKLNVDVETISLHREYGQLSSIESYPDENEITNEYDPTIIAYAEPIPMVQYDKEAFNVNPDLIVEGRFPENSGEIVLMQGSIADLDLSEYLNKQLMLNYNIEKGNPNFQGSYFKLVGIISMPESSYKSPYAEVVMGMDESEIDPNKTYDAFIFLNKKTNVWNKLLELAGKLGIPFENTQAAEYYVQGSEFYGEVFILSAIGLLVFLVIGALSFGGIYTVFNISYTERMRQYGLIRAVGATNDQIKDLIKREILTLTAVSIPLGSLLGILIQRVMFKMMNRDVFKLFGYRDFEIKTYPIVVISSAALAFVVVYISIYSASKTKKSRYPIELIRLSQTGGKVPPFKKKYRLTKYVLGMDWYLARRNIDRSKAKFFMSSVSIAITIVIFVTTMFISDLNDKSAERKSGMLPDYTFEYIQKADNNEEIELNELYRFQGVDRLRAYRMFFTTPIVQTDVLSNWSIEYLATEDLGDGNTIIYKVDTYMVNREELMRMTGLSPEQIQEVIETQSVIIGVSSENDQAWAREYKEYKGNSISINTVPDGERHTLNIYDRVTINDCLSTSTGSMIILLPEESIIAKSFPTDIYDAEVYMNDRSDHSEVESYIRKNFNLVKGISSNVDSKLKDDDKYKTIVLYMYLFVGAISILSAMNLFNSLSTNTLTRKKELSILKAVGMNDRAIRRMLAIESLQYCAFGSVLGLIGSFIVINMTVGVVGYRFYSMQYAPYGIMPIVTYIIAVLVILVITRISGRFAYSQIVKTDLISNLKNE